MSETELLRVAREAQLKTYGAGEVLVSAAAKAQAGGSAARFQRLAPAYVKGIAEPLSLFRALPLDVTA